MEIKLVLLVIYAVAIIVVELLIEKRLEIINKRHHQKMWWWNASFGLFTLFKRLKIILRVIAVISFLCSATIIILIT